MEMHFTYVGYNTQTKDKWQLFQTVCIRMAIYKTENKIPSLFDIKIQKFLPDRVNQSGSQAYFAVTAIL